MPQDSADNRAYAARLAERILAAAEWDWTVRPSVEELFRFLCEHPQSPAPVPTKVQCAVAIDSGNECLLEIFSYMLRAAGRKDTTVAVYEDMLAVMRMVRDDAPALLILHSNFLVIGHLQGMAGLVAVSPGTRYLIVTGWDEEVIESMRKRLAPLQVPISVLSMPFEVHQFAAALDSAESVPL